MTTNISGAPGAMRRARLCAMRGTSATQLMAPKLENTPSKRCSRGSVCSASMGMVRNSMRSAQPAEIALSRAMRTISSDASVATT